MFLKRTVHRHRHRQTHRHRHTQTHTHPETERKTETETQTETEAKTENASGTQTEVKTDRQTVLETENKKLGILIVVFLKPTAEKHTQTHTHNTPKQTKSICKILQRIRMFYSEMNRPPTSMSPFNNIKAWGGCG